MPKKFTAEVVTPRLAAKKEFESSFKWGDIRRYSKIKAYPFWYNFIPSPYQQMDTPPDFLCLPSPGQLEVPIVMDRDTFFKLFYIRYLVSGLPYTHTLCQPPFGPRYVDSPELKKFHPHDTHLTFNEHIDVEVIITSQRAEYLYGAPNDVDPVQANPDVKIASLQGRDDGIGRTIRVPFLVPKQATITVKFKAKHLWPTALNGYHVTGYLYGLKIYA